MFHQLEHITIENFKSIRYLQVKNLNRINLFIGRPNAGKSNFIEVLSLFSIPFLTENVSKKLPTLLRIEKETELFYNGNFEKDAVVSTNIGKCKLSCSPTERLKIDIDFLSKSFHYEVDDRLVVKSVFRNEYFEPLVKKYVFKTGVKYSRSHSKYLIPPFGFNLFSIIQHYADLKQQVHELFEEYNLKIAFDKASHTFKILQLNRNNEIMLVPYSSIAGTLQEIVFYKTAIATNNNSILLFENPEAHSFPLYLRHFTKDMIYKKDNQYFITTHSPFILNDLLENGRGELAVFVVHYESHETIVRKLSSDELNEVYQNGVDLFTNNESFV
ncbi:ATP/GTP-binding protein [Flavihumibacter sp. ZG627]|uniref:AAA family ATPase n=1 Tax=Flavihumibacter sp. ZG627 TaxID=1463156 RepID=UPI00057D8A73|nr:AAA family ATPase [Flavihumibacter sp. ZG627]KIC89840.1 hypothetical protein HY58_14295 [Flavihumibacter sp. ZG627]